MTIPRINAARLWADLMALGKIGAVSGQGVTRTALSDADLQVKDWLLARMRDAGLETRTDAVYNLSGRLRAGRSRQSGLIAVGSHLDSVPQGGPFDGALGVVAGLECLRTIREHGIDLARDVELINFCDEEAAHNTGTVGSRAMLGLLHDGEIHQTVSPGRGTFADALRRTGKDPVALAEARRQPTEFACYLELHIEQGRRLENAGIQIGAVTAIVGIYRYLVTVTGEAAHAGTTPMALRNDALVNAAPLFTLLPEWVRACSPEMVGTIGRLEVHPGAPNVVPGRCRFVVEIRSQHREDMLVIRDQLRAYAGARGGWQVDTVLEKEGTPLAEPLIQAVADAAAQEGLSWVRLPSGAGHDAQSFAAAGIPAGMIFIPCRHGISHHPDEWIEPEQAAQGCQVLLRTLLGQANRA